MRERFAVHDVPRSNALDDEAEQAAGRLVRALVTGGAGYIGSHTVRALLDAGHEVLVFDDLSSGHADAVDPRATFLNDEELLCHDLTKSDQVRGLLRRERPDAVIHFAGRISVDESFRDPQGYWYSNVATSLALLDAIADLRFERPCIPFVFSSSAAVYGSPAFDRGRYPKLSEDHPTNPTSPYGDTKLVVERALNAYGRAYNIPWMALRYFNAAGANVEAGLRERHDPETHLIPRLLECARVKGERFTLHGADFPTLDGSAVRDFVHVMDLARAHVSAAERLFARAADSCALNLGTGTGHSVFEVVKTVSEITESPISVTIAERRRGDPPCLVADASRADKVLGWRPKRSDLRAIVADAWAMRP